MRDYLIRTPGWLSRLYPERIWRIPTQEKRLYLTFDDGPHPQITEFVLQQLDHYQAKASFFCIGENVDRFPDTYNQIRQAGHTIGNHTHRHVNGWKTNDGAYLQDVIEASRRIQSDWFRPPYGRVRSKQVRLLKNQFPQLRIAMWDVLSGDFDPTKTGEWCAHQVNQCAGRGSIVVMHDSEKAWNRIKVCLPKVLAHFSQEGYRFLGL